MKFKRGDKVRLKDQTRFNGCWAGTMMVKAVATSVVAVHPILGDGRFDFDNLELVQPETTADKIKAAQSTLKEKRGEVAALEDEIATLMSSPPQPGDVYESSAHTLTRLTIKAVVGSEVWFVNPSGCNWIEPIEYLETYGYKRHVP